MAAIPDGPAFDDLAAGFATHEVMNQAGALENYNAFSADTPLVAAIEVFGAGWSSDHLAGAGARHARRCNEAHHRPAA